MFFMTKIKNQKFHQHTEYNARNWTIFCPCICHARAPRCLIISFIALRINCTLFIITFIFTKKIFFCVLTLWQSCRFLWERGGGSHLVNVWKLNKAMLAVWVVCYYDYILWTIWKSIPFSISRSTNIFYPHTQCLSLLLVRSLVRLFVLFFFI